MLGSETMFKYYIFAFIKANLVALLIIGLMYLIDYGAFTSQYYSTIWWIFNLYFQIMKPSYKRVEEIEDEWTWIRIMENKKWYHRYTDEKIRKKLK